MSTPLRWRRPDRKSSTPFFPGAWPDASAQDVSIAQELPIHMDRRPQSKASTRVGTAPLANLDHVTDFHRRLSRTIMSGQGPAHPGTMAPSTTNASTLTYSTNNTASSALATPETLSPSTSHSFTAKRGPTSWRNQHNPGAARVQGDGNKPLPADVDSDDDSYVLLDARSPQSPAPPVPYIPLSLPMHTFSFSPESVASYFTTSEQVSRNDTQTLSSPPSSTSASPPSLMPSGLPPISMSSDFRKDFHSLLYGSDRRLETHKAQQSPSSVDDAGTDSPVLPSDDDNELGIDPRFGSSRIRVSGQAVAPTAADMDAFGMSARQLSRADSVRSIPTSFDSGGAADSVADHQPFSLAGPSRLRAYRRSSSPLSLSLNLSTDTLSLRDARGDVEELFLQQMQRNPPHIGAHPEKTIISTVVNGGSSESRQGQKKNGPSRFWNVKALGQKLKNAFSFKTKQEPFVQDIGVTTTTAVTSVEYTSEHPIPGRTTRRKTEGKNGRLNPADRPVRDGRRRSMPTRTGTNVSRPGPLRPSSFLAMDSGLSLSREALSSHRLLPAGSGSWISRQTPPANTSSVDKLASTPSSRKESKKAVPPQPSPKRRALTSSPGKAASFGEKKSRRFSLSSAFNKSRLDVLRTSVLPHPPLPVKYTQERSTTHDDIRNDEASSGVIAGDHGLAQGFDAALDLNDTQYMRPRARMATDASSQVVDISEANKPQPNPAEGRGSATRSRRQSSVSVIRGRKEPRNESEARHDAPSKRRSRGFSLSRRAMKGQSLPVGRHGNAVPGSSANASHGWEGLNGVFKGLHSNQAKREYLRRMQLQRSGSSVGCAEYDPNLVLDTMSFAQTPDVPSSAVTSTDHSSRTSPEVPGVPIHAVQMGILDGTATPNTCNDEADELERQREDREEERGFLRALGLEFDAIARRVEEQV